nr:hypothetical protein CFP56_34708 [Quercus suber]
MFHVKGSREPKSQRLTRRCLAGWKLEPKSESKKKKKSERNVRRKQQESAVVSGCHGRRPRMRKRMGGEGRVERRVDSGNVICGCGTTGGNALATPAALQRAAAARRISGPGPASGGDACAWAAECLEPLQPQAKQTGEWRAAEGWHRDGGDGRGAGGRKDGQLGVAAVQRDEDCRVCTAMMRRRRRVTDEQCNRTREGLGIQQVEREACVASLQEERRQAWARVVGALRAMLRAMLRSSLLLDCMGL